MNHRLAFAAFFTLLPLSIFAGCSDDETGDNGPSGPGSGAASSSGSPSSSSSASGGTGGSGAEGGAGATGGTGGTGTTGGAGGTGGGTGGGGTAADHLVISEVAVTPDIGEFIEIYNPGNSAVDLSQYWLADNSAYYTVTSGAAWEPEGTPGSDFAAKFPAGASLAGGARIIIGTHPGYPDQYGGACPTYFIAGADVECMGADVPTLVVLDTVAGDPLVAGTLLSNTREMLVLFRWDGVLDSNVQDVDYVTWGDEFEDVTRVDKTGVGTYAADTARVMQKPALAPFGGNSIERCPDGVEVGEKQSGGNGITGHDETSEDLAAAFKATMPPTPGAANACN
jgi:hypothetical protein